MNDTFSFQRYIGLTIHYIHSMKRNPARLIEIIVWPSFELLLFGMLALSVGATNNTPLSLGIGILCGVVYWNFSARIIQETIAQFLDDAFSKNLQNLLITPFSLVELALSLLTSSVIKLCLSFVFLISILYLLIPTFFNSLSIYSVLWLSELVAFGSVLSLIALSLLFLFGIRFSFIGWLISTILQVFSCVFFERKILPPILQEISYTVPSSYIFESIHASVSYPHVRQEMSFIPIILIFLYLVCSIVFLHYAFEYARRHGTLINI